MFYYILSFCIGLVILPLFSKVTSRQSTNKVNGLVLPDPTDDLWELDWKLHKYPDISYGFFTHPSGLHICKYLEFPWERDTERLFIDNVMINNRKAEKYARTVATYQRQRHIDQRGYKALLEG